MTIALEKVPTDDLPDHLAAPAMERVPAHDIPDHLSDAAPAPAPTQATTASPASAFDTALSQAKTATGKAFDYTVSPVKAASDLAGAAVGSIGGTDIYKRLSADNREQRGPSYRGPVENLPANDAPPTSAGADEDHAAAVANELTHRMIGSKLTPGENPEGIGIARVHANQSTLDRYGNVVSPQLEAAHNLVKDRPFGYHSLTPQEKQQFKTLMGLAQSAQQTTAEQAQKQLQGAPPSGIAETALQTGATAALGNLRSFAPNVGTSRDPQIRAMHEAVIQQGAETNPITGTVAANAGGFADPVFLGLGAIGGKVLGPLIGKAPTLRAALSEPGMSAKVGAMIEAGAKHYGNMYPPAFALAISRQVAEGKPLDLGAAHNEADQMGKMAAVLSPTLEGAGMAAKAVAGIPRAVAEGVKRATGPHNREIVTSGIPSRANESIIDVPAIPVPPPGFTLDKPITERREIAGKLQEEIPQNPQQSIETPQGAGNAQVSAPLERVPPEDLPLNLHNPEVNRIEASGAEPVVQPKEAKNDTVPSVRDTPQERSLESRQDEPASVAVAPQSVPEVVARKRDVAVSGSGDVAGVTKRPSWVDERMRQEGKNPDRLLNEIDASRPQTVEQLANDPVTKYLEGVDPKRAARLKAGDFSAAEYTAAMKEMNSGLFEPKRQDNARITAGPHAGAAGKVIKEAGSGAAAIEFTDKNGVDRKMIFKSGQWEKGNPASAEQAKTEAPKSEGPGAAEASDPTAFERPTPLGIKHAETEAQRAKLGFENRAKFKFGKDEDNLDAAVQRHFNDPTHGAVLLDQLEKRPRTLNVAESFDMLVHHRALENERIALEERIKNTSDPQEKMDLHDTLSAVYGRLKTLYRTMEYAGSEAGAAFRVRQLFTNEGYALHQLERTMEVSKGDKLTEGESTKVKEIADNIQKARRDLIKYTEEKSTKPSQAPLQKSDELRIKALEKRIAEIDAKISQDDLSVPVKADKPVSPEVKKLMDERDRYNALLTKARANARPKLSREEQALKASKTRTVNRIAEVAENIRKGELEPKAKEPVKMDAEGLRLKAELARWIREADSMRERLRLANRTKLQKTADFAKESISLARSALTGFDLSAVLNQGFKIGVSHPVVAARSVVPMLKAFRSEHNSRIAEQEILSRPNAAEYKKHGLFIAQEEGGPSAREEAFIGKWVGKIPALKGSERAYRTYLNKLRADTYDMLTRNAKDDATKDAVANYINIATGRGDLMGAEPAAKVLATALFSPRNFASQLEYLAFQPLMRGTRQSRGIVAKEYARTLSGIGVLMALGVAAGATLESDPRSSDYGKLKFGNTRIDPLGGLAQFITLEERLRTGETKKPSGAIFPITGKDVPMGGTTALDTLVNFGRYKLSPLGSAVVDTATRTNAIGEPTTPGSLAANATIPLAFRDVADVMREQGVPAGTIFSMLSILGMRMNTYNNTPDANTVAKQMKASDAIYHPTVKQMQARAKRDAAAKQ